MAECDWCNEWIDGLPYRCNECGYQFCSDHRLPEGHLCASLRSENLRFGSKAEPSDKDDVGSESEYPTADPVSYGAPKKPNLESSPETNRDGSLRDPPAKQGRLTASGREKNGESGATSIQRVRLNAYVLAMRVSRGLTRALKLSIPIVLIGMLLIAFTPLSVSNHWDSKTAAGIDSTLESTGDDIEKWVANVGETDEAAVERRIHSRINEMRSERGLSTLQWSDSLHDVAAHHSDDMAKKGYFAHTSPTGESMSDRYAMYGVNCGMKAENIFTMKTTGGLNEDEIVEKAVNGWMNSPGHRENILRQGLSSEAIAVTITENSEGETVVYVTQNFC